MTKLESLAKEMVALGQLLQEKGQELLSIQAGIEKVNPLMGLFSEVTAPSGRRRRKGYHRIHVKASLKDASMETKLHIHQMVEKLIKEGKDDPEINLTVAKAFGFEPDNIRVVTVTSRHKLGIPRKKGK